MSNIVTALAGADRSTFKRRLQEYHSDFRNRGLGPIEAVTLLADELVTAVETGELAVAEGENTANWFSLAFQQFISDEARATFGQYLTPLPVARHLASLVGSLPTDATVLDPFMGSGILLDAVADQNRCRTLGIEINQSVAHVGRASVRLSGHQFDMIVGDAFAVWLEGSVPRVDAVVMNPPFGAQATQLTAEQLAATDTAALLGTAAPPVELVAIELALSVVRPGGVIAAILPQSVLTNGRFARFRKEFFTRATLKHVTYLPGSTFIPFKGVARACVLVLENSPVTLPRAVSVFEPISVGYDDTGRPAGASDLNDMADRLKTTTLQQSGDFAQKDPLIGLRLGDIADVFRGRNPQRDQYVDEGAFLLKVGSLSGSFISWRERKRSQVPIEWARKNDRFRLREGDICFTGTAHRPNYIGQKVDMVSEVPAAGAVPSGEVIVVRLKEDAPITPLSLLYYLRSEKGYGALQSRIRGSSAHIYPKDIVEMQIPDPAELFDISRITVLHQEAERAFRTYLRLEDEIGSMLSRPDVAE